MSSRSVSSFSSCCPSLTSSDFPVWKDAEADQIPILERENNDGPPPIWDPPRRRESPHLIPPAPPTSRGASFDEPLCTQNARSSADLWLLETWFKQRLGYMDMGGDSQTPYSANNVLPQVSWCETSDSRDSALSHFHDDDQDDCSALSGSSSSMESCSKLIISRDGSFSDDLTFKHRNFATENLKEMEQLSTAERKPCPSLESLPSRSITSLAGSIAKPVQPCTHLSHCPYVECEKLLEHSVNASPFNTKAVSPLSRHSGEWIYQSATREGYYDEPRIPADTEVEPQMPILERSVWESDEPAGSLNVLASTLHLPIKLGRGQRRVRLRKRMPKFFRRLLCYRTDEEKC